jgi:hypothetical protein
MTENRIFTLCRMITWVVFLRMFWNFIGSLPVKRVGSLSFLVGTISNVLVMEIGWTDVGSGWYILVSGAHSNTSWLRKLQYLYKTNSLFQAMNKLYDIKKSLPFLGSRFTTWVMTGTEFIGRCKPHCWTIASAKKINSLFQATNKLYDIKKSLPFLESNSQLEWWRALNL